MNIEKTYKKNFCLFLANERILSVFKNASSERIAEEIYFMRIILVFFFLPIESLLCNTCYVLALNYLLCSTYKKVNVLVPRLVVHAQLLHNFRAGYKTGHSRN